MQTTDPASLALPQRQSLVAQTVHSLCEGIKTGLWHQHLPGERELCQRLQISRRTLRSALDELQRQGWLSVSGRRRRFIQKPHTTVIPEETKKVIGVLLPSNLDSLQPPTMKVLDTLRERLSEAGYSIEIHASRSCFSARPAQALVKLTRQHPAAAWLILGSKKPMQGWFIRQHVPCLVLGSCAPEMHLPSVDVDYHAACRHAGAVLLRKGHRHIALVLPKDAYGGDLASEEGLRESLASVPGARMIVLRHNGSTTNLCALLDKSVRAADPPSAYIVAHAMPALTTLTHLMRRGRHIPQDLALIARDDDPMTQVTSPALAHYAISRIPMARRASTALRQLAESGTVPAHAIRLIPKYVMGETV